MKTVYAKVHGTVQGVGYRYLVKEIAAKHGITGSVKNEDDGSVSIIATGDDKDIEDFFKDIRVDYEHGPSVFEIEFTNERPEHTTKERKEKKSFEIAR